MTEAMRDQLHRYLRVARESLLWKLEGLSEYDARRPLTPTGTNLLGLVRHVSGCQAEYFGLVFGRPLPDPPPWMDFSAPDNTDMWVRADESRSSVVDFAQRSADHADATIGALALDAPGEVPWWPEHRRAVNLHQILVHMVAETNRHAGQADILREEIDGTAGLQAGNDNLPAHDASWWQDHRTEIERAARRAEDATSS